MASAWSIRLVMGITAAQRDAANAWIRANADPAGGDWFRVAFCQQGDATFIPIGYLCAPVLKPAEFAPIARQLMVMAGATPPADWNTRTAAQKLTFFQSQIPTINATGMHVRVDANDGSDPGIDALLAARRWQRVPRAGPPG